jgi:hypothetical protein
MGVGRKVDVIVRLAALGVIVLHLVAHQLPEESVWGVWHYTVLSLPVQWLVAIAVASLALGPVNDVVHRLLKCAWDALPGKSHARYWFAVTALAAVVPFWVFRIRHLRWGDADFIVKALAYTGPDRPIWTIYNWQSPLTIFGHAQLWLLLHPLTGIGVDTLYALTSILAGIGFVYILFLLADQLGRDRLEKAVIFGLVITTGSMQLFFGYVENYTLMSTGLMLALYLGVRCLRGETELTWPSLALAVTNAFHPSTIVLWPAVVYLAWHLARSHKQKAFVWAQLVVPPVLVFAALSIFMASAGHGPGALLTNDRPGGADGIPFVPLFRVTTQWQHYTMFSLAHLLDWANEHFLISPFGLFLLVLAFGRLVVWQVTGKGARADQPDGEPRAGDGGTTPFLLIAGASYLLLTFVWNPDYGGRKDWDLFAPSAFVYTTLAAYLFVRWFRDSSSLRGSIALARNATLLIAAAGLHTATWIYYNTFL